MEEKICITKAELRQLAIDAALSFALELNIVIYRRLFSGMNHYSKIKEAVIVHIDDNLKVQ